MSETKINWTGMMYGSRVRLGWSGQNVNGLWNHQPCDLVEIDGRVFEQVKPCQKIIVGNTCWEIQPDGLSIAPSELPDVRREIYVGTLWECEAGSGHTVYQKEPGARTVKCHEGIVAVRFMGLDVFLQQWHPCDDLAHAQRRQPRDFEGYAHLSWLEVA